MDAGCVTVAASAEAGRGGVIARRNRPYVERFAVQGYIDERRKELQRTLLSPSALGREEARRERDFLEAQERIVWGKGSWKSKLRRLDPRLLDEVLRAATEGPSVPRRDAADVPEPDRPSHRAACEAMGFGELLRFIDVHLRALRDDAVGGGDGPRSEEDFLDLLGLLREKAEVRTPPAQGRVPNRASGKFVPSKDLRALREERDRLHAEAETLRREGDRVRSARFYEDRARRCRERADAWEAEERREHGLRPRRPAGPPRGPAPSFSATVTRVAHDIEQAFAVALPWEPLPPGRLTREGVLAHYERLARAYPERGYLPERILKALSLGPVRWWKGRKGFRGYVVFEYPGTERVLLECPVYGNAIYVLGENWGELSRKSKGAVMAGQGTERIPHAGGWSGKAKLALGIR